VSEGRRFSAVKIDFNDQASRFSRTLFTIIYIKPRATFIWGFSPNVCTLPLQSCCSFYYQGDILSRSCFWTERFYVSPLSSSTRQPYMSFTPSHYLYIFFSIYFLSAEACQLISGSMKLCTQSSIEPCIYYTPDLPFRKDGSSCGISPFPSSFDASGFVRRAGALRNVCILYHRSSRAFFV